MSLLMGCGTGDSPTAAHELEALVALCVPLQRPEGGEDLVAGVDAEGEAEHVDEAGRARELLLGHLCSYLVCRHIKFRKSYS